MELILIWVTICDTSRRQRIATTIRDRQFKRQQCSECIPIILDKMSRADKSDPICNRSGNLGDMAPIFHLLITEVSQFLVCLWDYFAGAVEAWCETTRSRPKPRSAPVTIRRQPHVARPNRVICQHWRIKNELHLVLNVGVGEDRSHKHIRPPSSTCLDCIATHDVKDKRFKAT